MSDERLILRTSRLRFVMWNEGDAPLVQWLHSTAATTQFLAGNAPWTLEKAERHLRGWFEEQVRDGTTKYKLLGRTAGSSAAPAFRGSGANSSSSVIP